MKPVKIGMAIGAALASLSFPSIGHAQEPAPAPPEADHSDAKREEALKELLIEVKRLREGQAKMQVELDALKRKQSEVGKVQLPPPEEKKPTFFLTPTASIGLRYDNIFPSDPLGQFRGDPYIDGFRMRVRAGLEHVDPDAAVIGGVRLSLGQPVNPATGYVPIGDAFAVAPVGMDRFWASFRPFDDRSVLAITVGKMPLPFWRGDRGRWRSELTWDSDVNPTGIALDIKFLEYEGVVVDNTAAYFVLHDIEDLRFQGLTGPASLIADQLRVSWKYITAAFAFYDYENLNTGMSAPSAATDGGASVQPAQNAYLLGDGLQTTNSRVSYGIGAAGFAKEAFRIINPSAQGHIPLPLDDIGKGSELVLTVDYSHNLTVPSKQHGVGGTAAIATGDHQGGWLGPLELWFTYRLVQADATLATFADSNLGQGTDFRGFEIGASYEATRAVVLSAGYFDYLGAPAMDAQTRRFMLDVTWHH